MKRILNVAVLPLALSIGLLYMSTVAEALPLNFSSVGNAQIRFAGATDTFTFEDSTTIGSGRDFRIGSVTDGTDPDTIGLLGNISGIFTIGAVTVTGGLQTAPVTGIGSLSIVDEAAVPLTGILEWLSISTDGASGALNSAALVNLTGLAYAGSNSDLQAFSQSGIATANFSFVKPVKPLTALKAQGQTNSTTHQGSITAVPEPTSLLLLGSGLLGLAYWKRKSGQA